MKNLVTPLYLEIKQWLMKEIENAPINSPIPSERELSKIFHTSRMTVRNAVNELVAEGFLYRKKTKGTFVADKSLLKKNTAAEVLKSEHDSEYTIIYFNIRAIPEIAPALNLLDHERILRVVRVFSEQEQPVTVEEIYFPFENVQSVVMKDLDDLLDMKQYTKDGVMTQKFFPMLIPEKYANQLNMKMGTPIIMIETTIRDKAGTPILLIKAYSNPSIKQIEIIS